MKYLFIYFLCVLCGSVNAQSTYFNKRYPQPNGWGGGTRTIVVQNGHLHLNIGFNLGFKDFMSQRFMSLDMTTGDGTSGAYIQQDSVEFFSGSLISYSKGGFYDVFSVVENGLVDRYMIVKYDAYGDTVFTRLTQKATLYQANLDVKESHDANLVFTGITRLGQVVLGSTHDAFLIKTDSLGNELWHQNYGDTVNFEQGHCLALTPDGGYIIGGVNKVPDRFTTWEEERPYLIKTDGLGNVEWEKKYALPGTRNMPIYGVTPTSDGGYVFVGGLGVEQFVHSAHYLPWMVKVNSVGDTLWTRTNEGSGPDPYFSFYEDVIELSDGSLVACGQQDIPNPDTINFEGSSRITGVITKYSSQGDLIWSRNYSHPGNNLGRSSFHNLSSIVSTPDGGFAAAGGLFPSPPDTGSQDTWVIKVDSFGCLVAGCEVSSVPRIRAPIAQLKLYPNPAHEILNIEITPSGNQHTFEFELYDLLGKRMFHSVLFTQSNTLNVSHLPAGMYTYKIGEVWGQIIIK